MAAPVVLLLLLLAGAEAGGGLYSREANEAAASPSAEFRLVRLNQLWGKAQRVSGGPAGGQARPGGAADGGTDGAAASLPAGRWGSRRCAWPSCTATCGCRRRTS